MATARPNQPGKYKQGYFVCQNPDKYIANLNEIVYRSSLEYKFCLYMDTSDRVLKWGSEVVKIPYYSPLDQKQHMYHMDFYVEMKSDTNPSGIERLLVEVKPHDEAIKVIKNTPPPAPKTMTPKAIKNWEYALKEHVRNQQKWNYAQEWARQRHMKFMIVTEKILNQLSTGI
jgi:hypothetical protein